MLDLKIIGTIKAYSLVFTIFKGKLISDRIERGCGHVFYATVETELKSRGYSKCLLDVLESNEKHIGYC